MRGKSERWKDERAKQPFLSLSLRLSLRPTRDEVQIDLLLSRCVSSRFFSHLCFFFLPRVSDCPSFILFPFPSKNHSQHLISLLLCDSFFFPSFSFFVSPSAIFLLLLFLFPFPALFFFLQRRKRKKRERENTQNGRNCKKEKRQKEQRRRISGEGEEWSGRAFLHPLNQRISIDFFPKKVGLAFYPTKFFWFLVNNCTNYIIKKGYYFQINKKQYCCNTKTHFYDPVNQI